MKERRFYMSKPKYMDFSYDEMKDIIKNVSSMEEVLEKMQYSKTRDTRFINAIRNYCETLSISTEHLPNLRDVIQCNCCKQYKTFDNFYFSKGKLGQKICKDCVREKEREKYSLRRNELNEFKSQHPCMKCGCSKHYLIDFHHLNPEEKDFTISDNSHAKFETLMKEIDKCVSLCSNCHREFHYFEREQGLTIEEYLNGVVE